MLQPSKTASADEDRLIRSLTAASLAIAAAGALTVAGAWYFQYGLGLAPCPLCLQQRWPYYVAVPLGVLIAGGAARGAPSGLLRAGLILIGLAMLVGVGLGVYHAGVEWKWWAGPTDCAGAFTPPPAGGSLLQRMQETRVVRCDEAAWRDPILKQSLAGYNVLISLVLALIAFAAAARSPKA